MAARDLLICQQILWKGSKSFAAASLLLPWRVRWPAVAVYAFCRIADDAVDDGGGSAALTALGERLDAAYSGTPWDNPVDRAFAEVVARFAIPRAIPEALFEGFAWDVDGRSYVTLPELESYCARVAATVGVMMTMLMGRRDAATLARACDLGVAMQLTNIARDVGEDARAGRVYLPTAWLDEEGVEPTDLGLQPRFTPALGRVVERLLAAAAERYTRADEGIALLPRDCRLAIASARLIYSEIGREVEHASYDSIAQRAFTTRWRKVTLMGKAMGLVPRSATGRAWPIGAESEFLVAAVTS